MISMSSEVTPTSRVSTMYARGIAATTARATSANSDRYRNLRWLRNVGVLPEASKLPWASPGVHPSNLPPARRGARCWPVRLNFRAFRTFSLIRRTLASTGLGPVMASELSHARL